MNKLIATALISLLGSSAAMADGLSRADVLNELVRARAAGELSAMHSENFGFSGYAQPALTARSSLSRAAVKAELQDARQSGAPGVLNSAPPAQLPPPATPR